MNQKGFINIIIIIGIIIITATVGYIVWRKQFFPDTGSKACTQEAKLCSDGSYVGRTGPNCEFAPCPGGVVEVSLREGQRESSLLVKKIYPDRIEGLNFWEYPIATGQGHPVTLSIGETASNGCTIMLTLIRVRGGVATFIKKTDYNKPCPICLSGDTLINTPLSTTRVKDMRAGMPVWTLDAAGNRIAGVVRKTSKTPVPLTHQMVHLVLNDGRELFASPRHPTIDERTIENLVVNDLYDGARVISVARVPYSDVATYDILPSGETGFYWANGILLDSTLH